MNTTSNPDQALWEKGDFGAIATWMRASGDDVVRSLQVRPGTRALDLGCGDGTTAIPLARAGADVTGVDISPPLVAAANRRAASFGLTDRLRVQHGDAGALTDLADASFDLVLSMFGAMFASDPFAVAKEMVRVTRPGGRIVMGNWIPDDPTSFVSQLLRISSAFTPTPPAGFVSPMTWGVERHIVERFAAAGVPRERIVMQRDTYTFRAPDRTPADVIAAMRQFYGPTMNAFAAATKNGQAAELERQLVALAMAQNRATDGGTSIPATFLRVTVQR